jgi:hypothetical protein
MVNDQLDIEKRKHDCLVVKLIADGKGQTDGNSSVWPVHSAARRNLRCLFILQRCFCFGPILL